MSDINYFHETKMNKYCLFDFNKCLPNHLRREFKNSFGGFTRLIDADSVNFLQGYRGPHPNGDSGDSKYLGPCHGLQEVRFWWGVSKHYLWLPVFGALAFAVGRLTQDTYWHSLYFDSKTGECLSYDKDEAAGKLNNKGCQLFQEGNYAESAEYHENAYQACSPGYKHEQTYKNNRDGALAEEDALNLNAQGESLFSQHKYAEALKEYRKAYDKSQIRKEYDKYKNNVQKAEVEVDAMSLNSQGDNMFQESKYTEALSKYREAYDKSQISKEKSKYSSNAQNAKAEIDAMHLNSEGDNLFKESKYTEALSKYQQAHGISKIKKEYDKYFASTQRAKAEIDALNLNFAGDDLFCQGKYSEALIKYQAAYDKSIVEKEKMKYALNINSAEVLKNKLSALDTLWKEAWEAETDVDTDRSGEAEDLFQRVLSETQDMLKMYPDNLRFKRYEILVSLKIDGNELFNKGLEAQQGGYNLLKEAEGLLQPQQKFDSALIKLKEAKSKFSEAQEYFEIGKVKDQRFASSIDFVQGQLDSVLQSIKDIEQSTLYSKLRNLDVRLNENNCLEVVPSLGNRIEDLIYFNRI